MRYYFEDYVFQATDISKERWAGSNFFIHSAATQSTNTSWPHLSQIQICQELLKVMKPGTCLHPAPNFYFPAPWFNHQLSKMTSTYTTPWLQLTTSQVRDHLGRALDHCMSRGARSLLVQPRPEVCHSVHEILDLQIVHYSKIPNYGLSACLLKIWFSRVDIFF